ncbi:hypothetical protein BDM02DRAFT_3110242, partial [Thelephora ganbajun]
MEPQWKPRTAATLKTGSGEDNGVDSQEKGEEKRYPTVTTNICDIYIVPKSNMKMV